MLEIHPPFSLGDIHKEQEDVKGISITFTINIARDYHPSKYHNIHSYYNKKWQHLIMLQYPCYIQTRLPVFIDKRTGKTAAMEVPWVHKRNGFTLLFEEDILSKHKMKMIGNYL